MQEVVVGEQERGRGGRLGQADDLPRDALQKHRSDDQHGRQNDRKCRHQASHSSGPESGEVYPPAPVPLLQEMRRYEIPGDDEEDVDTDEAAREPGEAPVESHDGKYRYGPKAIDIAAEAPQGLNLSLEPSKVVTCAAIKPWRVT
jgi:hypothetical protein